MIIFVALRNLLMEFLWTCSAVMFLRIFIHPVEKLFIMFCFELPHLSVFFFTKRMSLHLDTKAEVFLLF